MVGGHIESDLHPIDEQTVPDFLNYRAEADPERVFLRYGPDGLDLSFAEVNTRANAIANSLREMGVERGDIVSMLVENKFHGALVLFGIHKAGGIFAPINFEYEGSLLASKIDELSPSVLFVEDAFAAGLDDVAGQLEHVPETVMISTTASPPSLDDRYSVTDYQTVLDGATDDPSVNLDWSDEAAIIYTSGTTGEPKGVVVPYRWIVYYSAVRWQIFDREDVVHTSLPFYHGAAPYWDVAPALIVGTPVAMWDRYSPNEFLDRVNKYEATTVTLISVMHSWLMDVPEHDSDSENTLNKVQVSPLPEYHEAMAERFSIDFYTSKFGQQESGNPLTGLINAAQGDDATPSKLQRGLSAAKIRERADAMDMPVVESVPGDRWIGNPMPWMAVSVVNERDERLPPNEIGELVVRPKKPSVTFNEYYKQPAATLEEMRNLWFHVGDAVYYDEGGNFYHVDRMGNIIRRRGENIPAKQIENLVNEHDDVAETAAMAVPAPQGGEDEVAILIEPVVGTELTERDLRPYLDAELPGFMRPHYVLFTDEMPMTETNKIKRDVVEQEYLADL